MNRQLSVKGQFAQALRTKLYNISTCYTHKTHNNTVHYYSELNLALYPDIIQAEVMGSCVKQSLYLKQVPSLSQSMQYKRR